MNKREKGAKAVGSRAVKRERENVRGWYIPKRRDGGAAFVTKQEQGVRCTRCMFGVRDVCDVCAFWVTNSVSFDRSCGELVAAFGLERDALRQPRLAPKTRL